MTSQVYGSHGICKGHPDQAGNPVQPGGQFRHLIPGLLPGLPRKGERLQAFVVHLEGNLNQLWLRFPAKNAEHEVGKQLCDTFYGMHKGLGDSIRYIYDNLEMSYTQLMLAMHKAKSEASNSKKSKTSHG